MKLKTLNNQKGMTPIVILLLLVIGGAGVITIKNLPINQPQPTVDKQFQGSTSAILNKTSPTPQIKISPKPITSLSPKISPSPAPSTTAQTANNSNQSNNNNQSNSSSSNSNSSTNNSSSTPTPTTTPTNNTLSVSQTNVSVTLSRANPNYALMTQDNAGYSIGMIYGPGFNITSNGTTGWVVAGGGQGVGFYESSGGTTTGRTNIIHTYINSNKSNGTYTGTSTVRYKNSDGSYSDGPVVSYSITLTD